MACTSGCPTPGAHESWGDCLRAKSLQVSSDRHDPATLARMPGRAMSASQKWEAEMQEFPKAMAQGIVPNGTQLHQIRGAKKVTEATGVPFRGDK